VITTFARSPSVHALPHYWAIYENCQSARRASSMRSWVDCHGRGRGFPNRRRLKDRISVRTAFICVTFSATSPQEQSTFQASNTTLVRLSTEGLVFIKKRDRSERFRRYFAMGKIRGTPYLRSHIIVHRATTKYFSNSFVFKTKIEKEGLPRDSPAGLGAGGPRFKSGRPDQNNSAFM